MCGSRKYPYPPMEGHWECRGENKLFKGRYKPKPVGISRGKGGVQTNKPSVGGVWIFSGTTQ